MNTSIFSYHLSLLSEIKMALILNRYGERDLSDGSCSHYHDDFFVLLLLLLFVCFCLFVWFLFD
jgi:hypothetical protein